MGSQVGAAERWWAGPVETLEDAYRLCESITRHHSRSFFLATAFLPPEKRRAIRALYAFCRWSDDLVDEPEHGLGYSLDGWSARAHGQSSGTSDPVLMAWGDTRQRYHLDDRVIDELLAGVRMDLTINRYAAFDDLWLYCYRVASTVGLLSMQIIGHEPGAAPYAIKLGVALQLTNILRDVGEDARRGRIYLPLDEMARFQVSEQSILDGELDERYRALMRFQIERAQRLYEEAWPGIGMLDPSGQLAVAAAAEIYRAILPRIEQNAYDNHTRRAVVPTGAKLLMLPRLWWQTRPLAAR